MSISINSNTSTGSFCLALTDRSSLSVRHSTGTEDSSIERIEKLIKEKIDQLRTLKVINEKFSAGIDKTVSKILCARRKIASGKEEKELNEKLYCSLNEILLRSRDTEEEINKFNLEISLLKRIKRRKTCVTLLGNKNIVLPNSNSSNSNTLKNFSRDASLSTTSRTISVNSRDASLSTTSRTISVNSRDASLSAVDSSSGKTRKRKNSAISNPSPSYSPISPSPISPPLKRRRLPEENDESSTSTAII